MDFGLVMPNFAAWFNPEHIRETMSLAEELGYDSVWVNDHVVFPENLADHYGNEYKDPLALLPFMAACSTKLLLGTTVLVIPYRPPLPTAKMLATIDYLSEGRLLLGTGSGHEPLESEVLGLPYEERGAMTDEWIKIMIELWTNERASYEGKYYSFKDVRPLMFPIQKPYPRIFIGGASAPSFRRVIEYGAGWHPSGRSAEALEPAATKLRALCDAKGVPFPETSVRWSPVMVPEGQSTGRTVTAGTGETRWTESSPTEARAEVQRFADLGVTRLVVNLPAGRGGYLDQMRMFAEGVMS